MYKNKEEHNRQLLKCGLCVVTFFQKEQYKGGKKSDFTVEKPDKHCLSQVIKIKINSNGPVNNICPRYDVTKMALYCWFSSQKPTIKFTMRKTLNKFQ